MVHVTNFLFLILFFFLIHYFFTFIYSGIGSKLKKGKGLDLDLYTRNENYKQKLTFLKLFHQVALNHLLVSSRRYLFEVQNSIKILNYCDIYFLTSQFCVCVFF